MHTNLQFFNVLLNMRCVFAYMYVFCVLLYQAENGDAQRENKRNHSRADKPPVSVHNESEETLNKQNGYI